jgi:hypothetical protein
MATMDDVTEPIRSFFYPGQKSGPLSYEALQMRRKIAEAIMGRRNPYPKNIGEGLAAVGEAIGDRAYMDRLSDDEKTSLDAQSGLRKLSEDTAGFRTDAPDSDLLTGGTVAPPLRPAPPPAAAPASYSMPPPPPPAPPQSRPNLTETGMEPVTITPALTPDVNRFGQPNKPPPARPQSQITPLVNRDQLAMADMARQGVASPDPMAAQAPVPGPTIPIAATDEGDPRTAMAQAPYANPVTETDIRLAPPGGSQPSREPIPPASEQYMEPPGPRPAMPRPVGPSPAQTEWERRATSPYADQATREFATRKFQEQEGVRKELDARRYQAWQGDLTRWEAKALAYEKHTREAEDRRIKQQKERQDIEAGRGTIAESRRKLAMPETFMSDGGQFERKFDPVTETLGPAELVPGSPKPKVQEPTEGQAGAIQFVLRVQRDLDKADTEMNFGKALTDRREAAINAMLPRGIANTMLSDKYKNARDNYGNFMSAMLNRVSGASVTQSEDLRNSPAFIPEAGDSDERLRVKAQRRRDMVEAVKAGGGTITYDAVKRIMETQKSTEPQPAVTEGRTRTNRRTGEQQIYQSGNWVPVR